MQFVTLGVLLGLSAGIMPGPLADTDTPCGWWGARCAFRPFFSSGTASNSLSDSHTSFLFFDDIRVQGGCPGVAVVGF